VSVGDATLTDLRELDYWATVNEVAHHATLMDDERCASHCNYGALDSGD
jgi:hypothetical protein